MHTSYLNSSFPYEKCSRVVYHLHNQNQFKEIKLHGNENIRVVFVVTEHMSLENIFEIAKYVKDSYIICELTFRQMVGRDYVTKYYHHETLKAGHQKFWWYVEQNDYNLYYSENNLYTEYKKIH